MKNRDRITAERFGTNLQHAVVHLEHSAVGPGTTTLSFVWQLDFAGGGTVFFETDFAVEVIAP